ncbi:hypothetical protein ABW20_dc0110208 [Dactylellina cionopaga]|nr:hypothetical protein ABW20_dc0110208 [Dactylellina cionopaga]
MENLPRGRRSRRSSSNLNLTNISPLTTHFSLTALADYDATSSPQSSYIQGASAPSTPSILSRNPSRKRTRPQVPGLSVPATPRLDFKLQKAKSASHLLLERRTSSYFDTHHTTRRNDATEWVHRAGIALTSEARESKGQSWLASRASSTSLLSNGNSDSEGEEGREGREAGRRAYRRESRSQSEYFTPMTARPRNFSEATVRGDPSMLRLDIPNEDRVHPLAPEFIDETFMGSAFDENGEPAYFLDGEDDDDDNLDDEELHWSKRPRTGLGAWVDRMVGWSLFSVDEDVDSDEDHEHTEEVKAEVPPRLSIPNYETGKAEAQQPESPKLQDGSILADAGWVLGLAAKVIFQ